MISDEDRLLAKELVEALGIDPVQEGALRVILSSHRQLPADEKVSGIQVLKCRAVYDNTDMNNVIRCERVAGHPGAHITADNDTWGNGS